MPTLAPTSSLAQWTLILGFFMPLIIAVIQQCHWSTNFKSVVAFLICFAAAALQLGIQGQMSAQNLTNSGLALFALAIVFFKGFWKPTGIADKVEQATSLGPKSP